MRTAVRLLAVILLLPMLWACGKDEEFDYGDFLTEFVTYEGQEEGYACFTFRSRALFSPKNAGAILLRPNHREFR